MFYFKTFILPIKEDLYQGPWPYGIAFIFIFVTPQTTNFFCYYMGSGKNWLVWKMHPPLCSRREDKYFHVFLVLGGWSLVFIDTTWT